MTNNPINRLKWRIPPCRLESDVYDKYREAQEADTEVFLSTVKSFNHLETYDLPTLSPIRPKILESRYKGLTVCDLPLEEVGCGILATAQAIVGDYRIPEREEIKEIVEVIEEKGYYYVGRGLWWHWFNYFTGRANHWYQMVTAIQYGCPVTVLIKRPGDTRNFFTNLIGTKNMVAYEKSSNNCEILDPADFKFITSENEEYSLEELMKLIKTAPWIWRV